jgi:hypothetical protein
MSQCTPGTKITKINLKDKARKHRREHIYSHWTSKDTGLKIPLTATLIQESFKRHLLWGKCGSEVEHQHQKLQSPN